MSFSNGVFGARETMLPGEPDWSREAERMASRDRMMDQELSPAARKKERAAARRAQRAATKARREARQARATMLPPRPDLEGFGGLFAGPIVPHTHWGMRQDLARMAARIDDQIELLARLRAKAQDNQQKTLVKSIDGWIEDLKSVYTRTEQAANADQSWWK